MAEPAELNTDDMTRMPGLFRRWELAELIVPGQSYHIEAAGHGDDGTPLFAVYVAVAPDSTSEPE